MSIKIEVTPAEAGLAARTLRKAAVKADEKGDERKACKLRCIADAFASAFVRQAMGAHESEPVKAGSISLASEADLAIQRGEELKLTSGEAATLKIFVQAEWLSRQNLIPAESAKHFSDAARHGGQHGPGFVRACELIAVRMTELAAAKEPVLPGIWFGRALVLISSGLPFPALAGFGTDLSRHTGLDRSGLVTRIESTAGRHGGAKER